MRTQREQGLTLIEVLVAISIFAIVSVAVLSMFPAIFKLNSQTRADQAVTVGAKQFMEQVRVVMAGKRDSAGKLYFDYTETQLKTAGQLPEVPESTVNNYDCTPKVEPVGSATPPIIKRVTLDCTHPSLPQQIFVLDFGRPS